MRHRRIGEILLETSGLSEKGLEDALKIQEEKGGRIGEILIRQGEPVDVDWRGGETARISKDVSLHDGHAIVKEELLPDGRRKLILSDKDTGSIFDVVFVEDFEAMTFRERCLVAWRTELDISGLLPFV